MESVPEQTPKFQWGCGFRDRDVFEDVPWVSVARNGADLRGAISPCVGIVPPVSTQVPDFRLVL